MDEHFAYNLLVEVNFFEWGVGRSLGANGSLPAGLDEMLQPLMEDYYAMTSSWPSTRWRKGVKWVPPFTTILKPEMSTLW